MFVMNIKEIKCIQLEKEGIVRMREIDRIDQRIYIAILPVIYFIGRKLTIIRCIEVNFTQIEEIMSLC